MSSLYIHIPFCESRCIYCGFYSTTEKKLQELYVDALLQELEMRNDYLKEPLKTVYLGGGTPSSLPPYLLKRLFDGITKRIDTSNVVEWTMECNPDDVAPLQLCQQKGYVSDTRGDELCHFLQESPVNRVSMGAQTFDPALLKWINRRHTPGQVRDAVSRLRAAGIENISLDLMFGFPRLVHTFSIMGSDPMIGLVHTFESFSRDIDEVVALRPEHISAYSLMYEEGTPLGRMLEEGRVEEIGDEESREMYEMLIDRLAASGYEHYEISNFSRPGRRSLHNSSYWEQVPYLGLGASAHSYNICTRSWNVSNLREYIEKVSHGILPQEVEILDADTRYNDLITTALRTRQGIDLDGLSPEYRDYLLHEAHASLMNGLLVITDNRIHLTREGLFVSDSVMSDLVRV